MKPLLSISLLIVSLALFVSTAGCTNSQPEMISKSQPTINPSLAFPVNGVPTETREKLVAFVQRARDFANAEGKDKAIVEFDKTNGSFFSGQLYIYAYDFNGTTIAHPVNPEKIGVNRLNETDAKGGFFIRELRDQAMNGSGFAEYYYINPVHNNTIEKKLGYVVKVDDSWWLGSGIYDGSDNGGNVSCCAENPK
jgi:cytochrome c